MKLYVLSENTALNDGFCSEHGLSLYIESKGKRILFDMGQGELYFHNAGRLGIDIEKADVAVISHGHYDHGGGLSHFLSENKKAPVYIKKGAFGEFYNGKDKYIGLDRALSENERIIYTEGVTCIADGLTLYPAEAIGQDDFLGNFGLTHAENGERMPDSFLHEQYLLIEENSKRILISGCSHRGIIDIARAFSPHVIIGGFHTSKIENEDRLFEISKKLSQHNICFYTCHCTGEAQFNSMKKYLPDLYYIRAGQTVEI